jgi:large conductance mechanosensitive channel
MLKEFREFLQQGNVIDLAMAVIIGGAFGAIINSLVDDIFMPVIGILIGGIDFSGLSIQVGDAVILFGNFIQAIINFVIIASAMFLVIRSYNQLRSEEQSAPPKPSAEEKILAEIRDLLKERKL